VQKLHLQNFTTCISVTVYVQIMLQILNASDTTTGSLLLSKFVDFLDQDTNNVDASAAADIMEFLCIVDNSYLVNERSSERILIEMSAELLWWRVLEQLLDRFSYISAMPAVTVSRFIVCVLNMLAIVAGSRDILLIDRACIDESHYLSVFEQQAAGVRSELENSCCKVASKLLEYRLVDMPLVTVRREKSTNFSSQNVHKIVDALQPICCRTDPVKMSDVLARGKCREIVGITWLHPAVLWSLRQTIFTHSFHELSSTVYDGCISDEIISLCCQLKPVADDIDKSAAELTELQHNPQHHFERTLFIIRHRLDGCEGPKI